MLLPSLPGRSRCHLFALIHNGQTFVVPPQSIYSPALLLLILICAHQPSQAGDLRMTTLLDVPAEQPNKPRAMIFTVVAILSLAVIGLYFTVRYYPEKHAAEMFFNALVAGDNTKAYELWKPGPSYLMKDFLADWGPNGYYGPVKSYALLHAKSPVGASGVIITVAVSPFSPLPNENSDPAQSQKTRVVNLWVESKDKSLSFPP
jgi:hypothetical protein